MVVMEKGNIVRSAVTEVHRTGRNTQGVSFAKPRKHDSIVAVARNVDRGVAEDEQIDDVPSDAESGVTSSDEADQGQAPGGDQE